MKITGSIGRVFRTLAAAALLFHVLLWLAPLGGHHWLEAYDAWILDLDGYGSVLAYSPVLYWCLLACRVLVLAGLFFHVPAARIGLVVLVGLSIGLGFFWGIRVLRPYEAAFGLLAAAIDGALIAMAYCSPLRRQFKRAR